ncbi:hypothetical protein LUZ60_014893 [Juncus effusus]|nr:hypothetical protein LUZ60_014893 [Juncus effusus]
MVVYRVAGASEYLAITGWKVDDIKLAKKAWILPGQKCNKFDICPVNYTFEVQAMSAEKLPFILPAVFTIGPRTDDDEALLKYAKLISPHDKLSNHVKELVQGVIEGEARVLAASMTMDEIFKGTKELKQAVFNKVQLELNQFGLIIYNANVKQLVDVGGQEYFSFLGQKTQQEAANKAKARMMGEMGAKEREGHTLQNAAKVDADTKIFAKKRQGETMKQEVEVMTGVKIFENERAADVAQANSNLAMKKANWERESKLAAVEAEKAVAIRDAELQMEVEKKNAERQIEKLKGELLTKATVDYNIKAKEAERDLYMQKKAAEAELYTKQKEAEARRAAADADLYAKQKEAEARRAAIEVEFYAKQKQAEGKIALANADKTYISSLLDALGGNYTALRDYLMINNGVYQDIARTNADGIKGLQPKISVWNTNGEGMGSDGGAIKEMAGVYRMLPPLITTVQDQTGMQPPAWMGVMAKNTDM